MNKILFRTTGWEAFDKKEAEGRMLFELVAYVKVEEEVSEMCCGWAELKFDAFRSTSNSTHKLPINGGTPIETLDISSSEVRDNRSGFKFMQKALTGGVKSILEVSITVENKFDKTVATHA